MKEKLQKINKIFQEFRELESEVYYQRKQVSIDIGESFDECSNQISTIEPAFEYSEKLGTQRVSECCSEFGSLSYLIGNILEVIDADKFPLDKDYLEKVKVSVKVFKRYSRANFSFNNPMWIGEAVKFLLLFYTRILSRN